MSEAVTHYLINATIYAVTGLGFAAMVNHCVKWNYRQMLTKLKEFSENSLDYRFKQIISIADEIEARFKVSEEIQQEILKTLEEFRKDSEGGYESLMEEFANLEEKIVMIHQDILYMDSDLTDAEERIMRLEYRPGKPETQTIEAQAVQAPSMIRRRRQFSRMRRHGT